MARGLLSAVTLVVALVACAAEPEPTPNAPFMEAYFADPELVLPPCTWRVDVRAVGHLGRECGGDALTDLSVALVVIVTPAD